MPVSLFESKDLPQSFWNNVLDRAFSIKNGSFKPSENLKNKKVGMLFFEPSSRTRWSFEKACLDLGVPAMVSVVDGSTSKSKGETALDTLDLYLELGFDLAVVRSGFDQKVKEKLLNSDLSIVNAGFGSDFHPTQALLDYFTWTIEKTLIDQPKKILIMGDIAHSRVAKSHLRFSKVMGYEVGLLPFEGLALSDEDLGELKPDAVFSDRLGALEWAEVVMSLRVQKERHINKGLEVFKQFPEKTCLKASELKKDHIVMHPGPFMRGEDLEESLIKDSRSLIFKQKRNGVYCRAALLSLMLEENEKEV
jgi:aspartate carbamoyltransferase catalytic subunit